MIDWVTCTVPFRHPFIPSGSVVLLNEDGVIEKAIVRRRSVEGSHSSTITVRSLGSAGEGMAAAISLSGNPSKFLQGHNVFGSDDLLALVLDTFRVLDKVLSLGIDDLTYSRIARGEYEVSTVDINYSFELPSAADVQTWLSEAEMKTRSRCGRPTSVKGTVYWQKNSKRWAMKAYSKFQELLRGDKGHQLPLQLQATPLMAWAEKILRVELRLKKLELRDLTLTTAKDLAKQVRTLFGAYQEKLTMPTQLQLFDKELFDLPPRVRLTYHAWKAGHNLREMLPRNTFYRHRKELLVHGIDISISMDREGTSNVVPFIRILEAKPVGVPQWAVDERLVHHSAVVNF